MPEDKKVVSTEETLMTLMYVQEAILNILEQKDIAKREEVMKEVNELMAENAKLNQ
ncbi:MAG: hypothetical protein LHV68_09790 [Elusimicrobia bacterium]|nr:hypothetical protein [Candidatus Liberimonas magnetica]